MCFLRAYNHIKPFLRSSAVNCYVIVLVAPNSILPIIYEIVILTLGADLEAASAACQNIIPGQAQGHLGYVLSHLGHPEILPFMEAAVEARTEIAKSVTGNLNLMYLDLALENQIRQAAERGAGITGVNCAYHVLRFPNKILCLA